MTTQDNNKTADETPVEEEKKGRPWYFKVVAGLILIVASFLIVLIIAIVIAIVANPSDAANWVGMIRDVFIIVLALEGMLMGIALIVLVLQLAALINLIQNEIPPIMNNANETVTTVRGTAQFVSESVVEPVIKLGAATTGVGALLKELIGLRRTLREADKAKQAREVEASSPASTAPATGDSGKSD